MNNKKDRREEIEFRALESNGKALLDREVIETFLSAVHDREEARIMGTFKKVCQAAFLVQLNFQSIWKENIKLRHS